MKEKIRATVLAGFCCLPILACNQKAPEAEPPPAAQERKIAAPSAPHYLGSNVCKECHNDAYQDWQGSQHQQAMQKATDATVLGDFNNTSFNYNGVTSRFFKRDGAFFVNTDNAEGELQDFRIDYTFGVQPLQQYLIDFPDGSKQALGIPWDTRPKKADGQRWFHLYPDDAIEHGDPLHWTRLNQNWNYQCADCHSTNVKKNYNPLDGHYQTSWSEISVGCEACHGPASNHVDWAQTETYAGDFTHKGFAADLNQSEQQLDSCARCHARRSILAENFTPGKPLLNYYEPALLDAGLYHANGQILDEVYVYGSFLQSKMHNKGVACSDCHNAHNAELQASGNGLCTQCHRAAPPARFPTLQSKVYASTDHHFHPEGSSGAQCVACHMPAKTYMQVDERHDHGFRLPRPDLTLELGIPNTCNACHSKESAQWAVAEIEQRFGKQRPPQFATTLAAARTATRGVSADLLQLANQQDQPGIVRATAYSLFDASNDRAAMQQLNAGLQDNDPLVRIGAVRGAESLDINTRWQLLAPLLDDSLRAVRGEAARLLAPVLNEQIPPGQHASLKKAVDEYIAAQELNADRPEAQTNLGLMYARINQLNKVEPAYRKAIELDPSWVPAYVNLADFMRAQQRDSEGEALLKKALHMQPDNAEIRQAWGLWLSRQGRNEEALRNLHAAAKLAPENSRYAYVHAIALNSAGSTDAAIKALQAAEKKFPEDIDVLYALSTIYRDQGKPKAATRYARRLVELQPQQVAFQQLLQSLRP